MKAIIIYTSMTGTTEEMANLIAEALQDEDWDVQVEDAFCINVQDLLHYEIIIVGCYTWGNGDIPDEIVDFYEELQEFDLQGKRAAVFGPGSSQYEHYAHAVNLFEHVLINQGCYLLTDSLKVDREKFSDDEIQLTCKRFAHQLINIK